MASSGTVVLKTESVDYGGTRGYITLTNNIGWSVNDNGVISFNLISSSDNVGGTWGICTSNNPYYVELKPQVNYGSGWVDLDVKRHQVTQLCSSSSRTNTIAMSQTLINQLGSYTLTADCQLRFLYYMTVAPAPSAQYPHAFPNSSYSSESQVPVHIDVSWTAKLVYNANGGSGAPGDTTATDSNDPKTLTVSSTIPTRTNYRFDGWKIGNTWYHGGDTISVYKSSPTQTLYAQWTEFYRPGATYLENTWKSHNRSGGAADKRDNNAWVEMRTIDAPSGQGDNPSIRRSDDWYNQAKVGAE